MSACRMAIPSVGSGGRELDGRWAGGQFGAGDGLPIGEYVGPDAGLSAGVREPPLIELVQAPPDVIARGEIVPLEADEEPIEFSWARQTARRVGTVVHETLERFGRGATPGLDELPRLRPRLISRLEALGVEPLEFGHREIFTIEG